MKKIIKSRIFAFILGAIIFSGITSVATYTIFATDIGYTPKDTTWKKQDGSDITNVKDAIDELYNKANISNKEMVLINDNINFDTTHNGTHSITIDLSDYDNYESFTVDDFYVIFNSIGPAYRNGSSTNATVNIQKEYNSENGSITISIPQETYSSVGAWLNLSLYLYN